MKLSKKQRQELRMKFGGYCAYCGQSLPEKGWHADHVQAVLRVHTQDMEAAKKGLWKLKATGEHYREHNDTLENMFPSCAPCNLFKTTYTLEQFRKQIGEQVSRARSYSVNFRTAERFGLVQIVERPVVFWFEIYPLIVQNNS